MAAVSVHAAMTDSPRHGRSVETWKRHIVGQLKHRDRSQHDRYQELIRFYTRLLEKTRLTKGILSGSLRRPSSGGCCSVSTLLEQTDQLKKTAGELAYQVLELQQQTRTRERRLEEQQYRLKEEELRLAGAFDSRGTLQQQVVQVQLENAALKTKYDELLELQRREEAELRKEKLRGDRLLETMIQEKQQAAAHMNSRNQRRSRAREAHLQNERQSATMSKVTVESCFSAPSSRSTSPQCLPPLESREGGHSRLFRSLSASSPRILSSFRDLFQRGRGHSVCSMEEDLVFPVRVSLYARVPVRALQVLEAHEQGINAVRFSSSSHLLATGGTDREVKVWEVRSGSLTHRATLDGSTGGITCIEFDPSGFRILAASYDKSALLWRLDDSVAKLTLTGHRRKVTAARFSGCLHHVVTGSEDRSIRMWDLQRAACVEVLEVSSSCSDLVCSENSVISGHFDSRIRVWDTRLLRCVQELPARGKVTSLDISSDHRLLLSCCRDDSLQLVDLRGHSNERVCFRAEGFKCGSDSSKAVIRYLNAPPLFSPDGCFLAAGSADGAVYIWNVSTGNLETRLPDRHSSSISAVAWSLSGEYIVSVDKSRRAVLWSDI
ncbi:ATG16 autophagy related 16-like 2 isoform 2-T2 [Spinachia spinachia]